MERNLTLVSYDEFGALGELPVEIDYTYTPASVGRREEPSEDEIEITSGSFFYNGKNVEMEPDTYLNYEDECFDHLYTTLEFIKDWNANGYWDRSMGGLTA